MILVTAEDRDANWYFSMNKTEMKASIAEKGYILNVIVDAGIAGDRDNVGIRITTEPSNDNTIFQADGAGGYTTYERNNEPYTDFVDNEEWWGGETNQHYLPLVADTCGAAWNINILRDNNAVLVDSFTKAFVEIKVEEIAAITPAPTKVPSIAPSSAPSVLPTTRPSSTPSWAPSVSPSAQATFPDTPLTSAPVAYSNPTGLIGSKGDPHFKSWTGEHFEFHGQSRLDACQG